MTTIYQLRRATPVPDCHCHRTDFNCHQGRRCPEKDGASACSELLEDDETFERRMKTAARFWTFYAAVLLVALCAAIAHFLPALKTLAN